MKNRLATNQLGESLYQYQDLFILENKRYPILAPIIGLEAKPITHENKLAEILFITSYPPRECGIATYSQDLIKALNNKFSKSLQLKVCALEADETNFSYPEEVKYTLKTSDANAFPRLAIKINNDKNIRIVLIQHEFGFYRKQEKAFLQFIYELSKPVAIVFHTVLPNPDGTLKAKIKAIAAICESIIVMTHRSADILKEDYGVSEKKVSVIAHGTHLVKHLSEKLLKEKYGLSGRKVLTTFGLLSSGKSIETTLSALPAIIKSHPEVMFLIIGKTHPEVVKSDGEKYREMLELQVKQNHLQDNVRFVNQYLPLPDLLEYLQLTDIYVFTTNDPNQAVSGTFAYAMSCACPIISTPIPHAKEVLTEDTGIIFDFRDSGQLANGVLRLLNNDSLRKNIGLNTLQKIVSTAWENSAVSHAKLLEEISVGKISVQYNLPDIKLDHLKKMTTVIGIIQFSKINQPDLDSGYTLDDNARALVAFCMHYKLNGDASDIVYISKYLEFIEHCQQPDGDFLNYVDQDAKFTEQNNEVNLDDSNGRAVWALGYLISLSGLLPVELIETAEKLIKKSLRHIDTINSTRSMAFAIKGLYLHNRAKNSNENIELLKTFANRLVQMYRHEAKGDWKWFEGYLTYANSTLPEAMLYAWLLTRNEVYKEIAIESFNFLLGQTFNDNGIEVISNRSWLHKGQAAGQYGEQPIDVAYTIMTLSKFYEEYMDEDYRTKMETAFNWFLGDNRLHQIVYNPCTGGCYDGLEENNVNLNQGAESTVSYLMARLTIQKYNDIDMRFDT
ncbi:MAG: glycosyltransferase [Bacteroidales bacterium]